MDTNIDHAEITGIDTGNTYFFRFRAINEAGNSGWSPASSIVLGKKPSAPTTWSSTTTAMVGESLNLYWVHNAQDGSSEVRAKIELTINGATQEIVIENSGLKKDDDSENRTKVYTINTSVYSEGTTIKWRVQTCGVTQEYGDWSVLRTVDVYAQPTVIVTVLDRNDLAIETITEFPFKIKAVTGPNTQAPTGYQVTIEANEAYTTVDQIGNEKVISKGDAVYSKYFNTSQVLLIELSAGDIDLENSISYTIRCTAAMNSGLKAENSEEVTIDWTDESYEPEVEFLYDPETYTMSIHPYCTDDDGNPITNVSLGVYRREFDGSFVEIATGIQNTADIYVEDPHPALDYGRYRIVAITNETGAVGYYDPPGYPVNESAIIIQWDEKWSSFEIPDVYNGDALDEPPWSGSLLRLPYNVDVSGKNSPDVTLVKYIGRKHPTSYYGTQIGSTSSWKTEIPADDTDTLYAIRRLAAWVGDVYVREPSGSGYWANVTVSYSLTHCELTIPINFEITRVEGGM